MSHHLSHPQKPRRIGATLSRRSVLGAASAGAVLATAPLTAHANPRRPRRKGFASQSLAKLGSGDTAAIQALLDDPAISEVVIDDIGRDWLVGPLTLQRSNVRVTVRPDVVVRGAPGAFPGSTRWQVCGRRRLSGFVWS